MDEMNNNNQQNNQNSGEQNQSYTYGNNQVQNNNSQNSQNYYQNPNEPVYYQDNQPNNFNNNNYQSNYVQTQGGAGMAIASMVLGIVSLLFCCCVPYITIVLSIVGLVLGIVSISKNTKGRGMAIAGIILSGIGLLVGLVMAVIFATSYNGYSDFLRGYDNYFDNYDF